MDWDERAEIENRAAAFIWIDQFIKCRGERLTTWVSTFHKDHLPCRLANDKVSDDLRGSFNWTCGVVFSNGEKWMVRFPRGGKVKNADEKVEIEVATMNIVRGQTDIPVPEVKAWGIAADNELGLGPFIITSFIEGMSLGDILQDPESPDARLIRGDISEKDIETIYRQIAHFMLQLSKLNFLKIGSLSQASQKGDGSYTATIHSRPMTWKAHEILNVGGVDVFCPLTTTFPSTTDYFTYVAGQDWRHLHEQLNSVDNEDDAREKYIYWNVFRTLISRFISLKYDKGPFKLICDDFGPANMIVNNAQDLKIIAVIDWEWSYTGPHQLFWSPPRWLLIETPNLWDVADERLTRYDRYLEMFVRILEDEEGKTLGDNMLAEERPSALMRHCKTEGWMWFHHIIWEGFNGPTNVPFEQLRAAVPDFDKLVAAVPKEEVDAFVKMKMQHLAKYKVLVDEKKKWYEGLKAGG